MSILGFRLKQHDEKTIQAILRHANISTTNTCSIKTAAADAQEAMAWQGSKPR
jgi:hypothetical protein